jgi:WD40 repeat protein
MARVFVSHASADLRVAEQLHSWLRGDGHEVFLDRDLSDGILVGDDWQRRLHEQLRRADAIVCVLTAAYRASVWCAAEIGVAQSRGDLLLPVLAEPGVQHPLLGKLQYGDLTVEPGAVLDRLRASLREVDLTGGAGWPDGVSPYPGLQPFTTEQQRVFFGRGREVRELTTLLRSPAESAANAVLLLLGPSGCGKSSLVRAGLVPSVARQSDWWTVPPFLPGTDPAAALSAKLAETAGSLDVKRSPTEVGEAVLSGRLLDVVDEILRATPPPRRRRLLLVVDQFEELVTQTAPAERARFSGIVAGALHGPVRMVATVRPEFMDPLLADPDLSALATTTYAVRPLARDALRDVVVRPARAAGLSIDDDLVSRLVTDTSGGEALPLLAYTLAELAEGVERGGCLSGARYEQLGAVQGALSRQADAALATAVAESGRDRDDIVQDLLNLVTIDADDRPARRRLPINGLPDHVARSFAPFVARRLLTTDDETGQPIIGAAHEAFFSAWQPLQDAVTRTSVALRARRRVEQAAVEWAESGRRPTSLWERGQLASALADTGVEVSRTPLSWARDTWTSRTRRGPTVAGGSSPPGHRAGIELSAESMAFLRASARRDRRRRGRGTAILSVLLAVAVVAAVVAVVQQRAALDAQHATAARAIVAESDRVRDANPREALRLGLAAVAVDPGPSTRGALLQTLAGSRYRGTIDVKDPDRPGSFSSSILALSPDGRHVATTSTTRGIDLWDVTAPGAARRLGKPLAGTGMETLGLAFAGGGTRLLSTDGETLLAWDVGDPENPALLGKLDSTAPVLDVAVGPDQSRFITTHPGGSAQMWQLTDGSPRSLGSAVVADGRAIRRVLPFGAGGTIAFSVEGGITFWNWTVPGAPAMLGAIDLGDWKRGEAAISPDGALLAVSLDSIDQNIQLWDVRDPSAAAPVDDPFTTESGDGGLAFSPDGTTLASAGFDGTTILWDVRRPDVAVPIGDPLTGHRSLVVGVAYSADGRYLFTTGIDGTVMIWAGTDGDAPSRIGAELTGHDDDVEALALSHDGTLLASGGGDTTVRLWDFSDVHRPVLLPAELMGNVDVADLDFAPDRPLLAVGGADESLVFWDLTDLDHPARLPFTLPGRSELTGTASVRFSPRGKLLAVADRTTVALWDVSDPRQPRQIGDPLDTGPGYVLTLAFSPDGRRLAAGSADQAARVWDVSDPERPNLVGAPLGGSVDLVTSVAFDPSGAILATASEDVLTIWDVSGESPQVVGGPVVTDAGEISDLTFAPDGMTLMSGGWHSIDLWDVSDRTRPRPLVLPRAEEDDVESVAVTPDGDAAVTTALASEAITVWDLVPVNALRATLVPEACARSGGMIDRRQWDLLAPGIDYVDLCAP